MRCGVLLCFMVTQAVLLVWCAKYKGILEMVLINWGHGSRSWPAKNRRCWVGSSDRYSPCSERDGANSSRGCVGAALSLGLRPWDPWPAISAEQHVAGIVILMVQRWALAEWTTSGRTSHSFTPASHMRMRCWLLLDTGNNLFWAPNRPILS